MASNRDWQSRLNPNVDPRLENSARNPAELVVSIERMPSIKNSEQNGQQHKQQGRLILKSSSERGHLPRSPRGNAFEITRSRSNSMEAKARDHSPSAGRYLSGSPTRGVDRGSIHGRISGSLRREFPSRQNDQRPPYVIERRPSRETDRPGRSSESSWSARRKSVDWREYPAEFKSHRTTLSLEDSQPGTKHPREAIGSSSGSGLVRSAEEMVKLERQTLKRETSVQRAPQSPPVPTAQPAGEVEEGELLTAMEVVHRLDSAGSKESLHTRAIPAESTFDQEAPLTVDRQTAVGPQEEAGMDEVEDEGDETEEEEEGSESGGDNWNLVSLGEQGNEQKLIRLAIPVVQASRRLLCQPSSFLAADMAASNCDAPRPEWEGPYKCVSDVERLLLAKKPKVVVVGSSGTGKTKLVNTLLKHSLPSASSYKRAVTAEDVGFDLPEEEIMDPLPYDPHAERVLDNHNYAWLKFLKPGHSVEVFYPCDVVWYPVKVLSVRDGPGIFVYAVLTDEEGDGGDEMLLGDGTGDSSLVRRVYQISFASKESDRLKVEDEDDYFLLKEGSVLDSTMVPVSCIYGSRLRIRHYFEAESVVHKLLARLKKAIVLAWKEAGRAIEAESPDVMDMDIEGRFDIDDVDGDKVTMRPQWLQTALAMIARSPTEALTNVSLDDVALPPRFKGLLGKVKTFTPRLSSAGNLLEEHVCKVKRYLNNETRMDHQYPEEEDGGESGAVVGEPYWRLSRKVVLEIPSAVLREHDIVDTQGVTSNANAFVQQDLTEAQFVIAMMDGRADQDKVIGKLQKEFLEPLVRYAQRDSSSASPTALLAVVVHGEKAFPATSAGTVPCTVLAKGPEEKKRKLRDAEDRVLAKYKKSIVHAISSMLIGRSNTRLQAEALARSAVQECVQFFYIYSQLLYEPEKFMCSAIKEEDSGLPKLKNFLIQALPTKQDAGDSGMFLHSPRIAIAQVAEVLRQVVSRAVSNFQLARMQSSPSSSALSWLESRIQKVGLDGLRAWKAFRLDDWASSLKESVRKAIQAVTDERAANCTAENYGVELARKCIELQAHEDMPDDRQEVGRVPPYLFSGRLKEKLEEAVRVLHNRGEYKNVKLYELMAAAHFDWTIMPFPGDLSLRCFQSEDALKVANEDHVGPLLALYRTAMALYDAPIHSLLEGGQEEASKLLIVLQSLRSELRSSLLACLHTSLGSLAPIEYFSILCNQLRDCADSWVCQQLLQYVGKSHGAVWNTRSDRGLKITRFFATCKWCPVVGDVLGKKYVDIAMSDLGGKIDHLSRAADSLVREHSQRCTKFSIMKAAELVLGPKLHRALQDFSMASVLLHRLSFLLSTHSTPSQTGRERWIAECRPWSLQECSALLRLLRIHGCQGLAVTVDEAGAMAVSLAVNEGFPGRTAVGVKEMVAAMETVFGMDGIVNAESFFASQDNDSSQVSPAAQSLDLERPNLWSHFDILHLLRCLKEVMDGPCSFQSAVSSEDVLLALTLKYNGAGRPGKLAGWQVRIWGKDNRCREGCVLKESEESSLGSVAFSDGSRESLPLSVLACNVVLRRQHPVALMAGESFRVDGHTQEEIVWILRRLLDFFGGDHQGFNKALEDYEGSALKLGPGWTVLQTKNGHMYKWTDPNNPQNKRTFLTRLKVRAFLEREGKKSVAVAAVSKEKDKEKKAVQLARVKAGRMRGGFLMFDDTLATKHGRVVSVEAMAKSQGGDKEEEDDEYEVSRAKKKKKVTLTPNGADSQAGSHGREAGMKRLLTPEEKERLLARLQKDGWSVGQQSKRWFMKPPMQLRMQQQDLKACYFTFIEVKKVIEDLDKRRRSQMKQVSRRPSDPRPLSRGTQSAPASRGEQQKQTEALHPSKPAASEPLARSQPARAAMVHELLKLTKEEILTYEKLAAGKLPQYPRRIRAITRYISFMKECLSRDPKSAVEEGELLEAFRAWDSKIGSGKGGSLKEEEQDVILLHVLKLSKESRSGKKRFLGIKLL